MDNNRYQYQGRPSELEEEDRDNLQQTSLDIKPDSRIANVYEEKEAYELPMDSLFKEAQEYYDETKKKEDEEKTTAKKRHSDEEEDQESGFKNSVQLSKDLNTPCMFDDQQALMTTDERVLQEQMCLDEFNDTTGGTSGVDIEAIVQNKDLEIEDEYEEYIILKRRISRY